LTHKFLRYKEFQVSNLSLEDAIKSESTVTEIRNGLRSGVVYKIPHNISIEFIKDFKKTLLSSLSYNDPGYSERIYGCKNNYRVHWNHKKQAIEGKFMSWSYYPWNSESTELFRKFKDIYVLRNKLAGLTPNKYLDTNDKYFVARIAAQFYPSGEGYMGEHVDPFNVHQLAIPTILLSKPGVDYNDGGFFMLDKNERRVYLDNFLDLGDLFLFHPSIPHGVEIIDKNCDIDHSKGLGRLMIITAVNAIKEQGMFQSSSKND
jgi:hypothetical protein